jgi:uncharacterized protein (DUF58 family)
MTAMTAPSAQPAGAPPPSMQEALARALAARHEVVVASPADPALVELATGRDDANAVYGAAAAELAIAGRARVVDQLGRLGVHVVDAGTDVFASHVADAYLDLKAAGKL